jgi:hypothetical protein
MKKNLFTLILLCSLLFTGSAFAQGGAYQKGDKLFNAGVSFGGYNYSYGSLGNRSGGFIPVSAALEFGVHESISVGPYVGYASWKYSDSNKGAYRDANGNWVDYVYTNTWRHSYISLGVRASWHYVPFLNEHLDLGINESKWDFYATLQAGLVFTRFNYSSTNRNYDPNDPDWIEYERNIQDASNRSYPVLSPFLGFKYLFTPKIGVFVEGGRGLFGYGTLGLSAKF